MHTAAKRQGEDDMDDAVRNLRDNARRTKEDIRDAVDTIKDDAESMAHEAGRHVRAVVNEAEKKVVAASKTVTDSINDNPVQSSLIALGVGVFLGMLFAAPKSMWRSKAMRGLPMIGKLLGLASIGGTFMNVSMLQRFLSGIAGVIALTVLGALTASMLIACGFFGIYIALLHSGMEPDAAMLTVVTLIFFLTVILGALAYWRLQQVREMPYHIFRREMPVVTKVQGVVNAFIEGFTADDPTVGR